MSFVGAMTLAGGVMLLLDHRPSPRTDGLMLSPLASATLVNAPGEPLAQTRAPLDRAKWQAIIIHHSGASRGDPASIEREHRGGGGLGHHFIIGNGNGMDDGQVHIGYRWLDQLSGAHAAGPNADFYNDHSISIALVGDGNRRGFTPAQLRELSTLVESLRRQIGLGADRVLLYSDLVPAKDPGRLFPQGMYGIAGAHE